MVDRGWAEAGTLAKIRARVEKEIREAAEEAVSEGLPDGREALLEVYTDAGASDLWTRGARPDPRTA